MAHERSITHGQVLLGTGVEVAEGRRKTIGAMFFRGAAQGP